MKKSEKYVLDLRKWDVLKVNTNVPLMHWKRQSQTADHRQKSIVFVLGRTGKIYLNTSPTLN